MVLRSLASILVPIVLWGGLWVAAFQAAIALAPDAVDEQNIPTAAWMLGSFILLSMLLSTLAGWLSAKIAPRAIMKHVGVLAVIQLLIGIAVQAGVWDQMPLWYHLPFLALVIPMHMLGGLLGCRGAIRAR